MGRKGRQEDHWVSLAMCLVKKTQTASSRFYERPCHRRIKQTVIERKMVINQKFR